MLLPTIIFFGTPESAKKSLEVLYKAGYPIKAVVTQSDKLSPRKKPQISEVKQLAGSLHIPIFEPKKIKDDEEFEKKLRDMNADLFVVVAYGKILPKNILSLPRYGVVNIHPSLLPKHRGPSPIQASLLSGNKITGVTIMLMDELMDHGPILTQEKVAVKEDETGGTLHERLMEKGSFLLLETLPKYLSENIQPIAQNHDEASYTKLLTREDGHIDWSKSAEEIEKIVRAFNPWPGSWSFYQKKRVKILKSKVYEKKEVTVNQTLLIGTVIADEKILLIKTGNGFLKILSLQMEGKLAQNAENFIDGYHQIISRGMIFE